MCILTVPVSINNLICLILLATELLIPGGEKENNIPPQSAVYLDIACLAGSVSQTEIRKI